MTTPWGLGVKRKYTWQCRSTTMYAIPLIRLGSTSDLTLDYRQMYDPGLMSPIGGAMGLRKVVRIAGGVKGYRHSKEHISIGDRRSEQKEFD